ncbi:MAG: HAMP domain-containing sensor histidine kinase [Bdellovibrionia bacterium]
MAKAAGRFHLPSFLAALWLAFSVSLAVWWLIFGLQQIDRLMQLQHEVAGELVRQQRMVLSEGGFLILCLLIGGGSLLYYIRRESRRTAEIKEFFATFTHELKTSLASLRLQTESLEEDLRGSGGPEKLLGRLVNDTVRLELQLENSLFLAHADASRMVIENLHLKKAIRAVQRYFPQFKITLEKDVAIKADERALDSVLKNIIQNAVVHGQATEMIVAVDKKADYVAISLLDNGKGFKGSANLLGKLFFRHTTKSGSGVGLFLSSSLMQKMGGSLEFPGSDSGFRVALRFREGAPA